MSFTENPSHSALKPINKLTITFLVDNCIEWFTALPPGFTLELPQHLRHQRPPIDELTGAPIADIENYCCGAHGFSALIETQSDGSKSHLTLFDTGPDSRSLVHNIHSMQVPVENIDRVILSHWHADHSGGLLSFLKLRGASTPPCTVDLHPDRPIARGVRPPNFDKPLCRLPPDPTFQLIEEAGGKVETSKDGHTVADGNVWVSGEIPRITPFEGGLPGGIRYVERNGESTWENEEHIMDERYTCIDVAGKGLVIFSACSHAGIVNVVKDALATFSRPIYMIIGGLHLAGSDLDPRIAPTVDFLRNMTPPPTYILPMHCSGFNSKVALRAAFGEGCVPAGVGLKVEVTADHRGNKIRSMPYVSRDEVKMRFSYTPTRVRPRPSTQKAARPPSYLKHVENNYDMAVSAAAPQIVYINSQRSLSNNPSMADLSPILPQMAPIADVSSAIGTFDGQEPPKSAVTNIDFGYDLMSQIRDVTSTPSTLSQFLQDPAVIGTLTSPATKQKGKTRRRPSSSRREPHGSGSKNMVGLVLAEEERQVNHLKEILKSTGDRLEHEIRRADWAEQRAEHAEARAREIGSRISTAEAGQLAAELKSIRTKEGMQRLQMHIETMKGELRRAQEDADRLERKRAEAEENGDKLRGTVKKYQIALSDFQAGEEAREETRRVEIQRWYDIGRQEGWDAGHEDGFEEGEKVGFRDGKTSGFAEGRKVGRDRVWDQGREQGRKEERQNALRAFEQFLRDEMHGGRYQDDRSDSMQRWTESEYFDDQSDDASSYLSRTTVEVK